MTASNTHFRMVLFLSTFAAIFVYTRVETVDAGLIGIIGGIGSAHDLCTSLLSCARQ